ncbi:hypothetical protein MTO96_035407 [Rhipicephalus appendiculatus]
MCSGDKLEDFLKNCTYPSGCLQLRENAYCISMTHPYGYNPITKTCDLMSRIGCGTFPQLFIEVELLFKRRIGDLERKLRAVSEGFSWKEQRE